LREIPKVLDSVPVTTIRKFARKSWRYMDAYEKGLEGRIAEWAVITSSGYQIILMNFLKMGVYVT